MLTFSSAPNSQHGSVCNSFGSDSGAFSSQIFQKCVQGFFNFFFVFTQPNACTLEGIQLIPHSAFARGKNKKCGGCGSYGGEKALHHHGQTSNALLLET